MIDALVVGRSLPALLAALELAEVGLRVVVAGGTAELPDGPERDVEGEIAALLTRIAAPIAGPASAEPTGNAVEPAGNAAEDAGSAEGLRRASAAPRKTPPQAPWLLARDGRWAPQPDPAVFGVPAVPLAAETLRLLGTAGALRAFLDRITPLLTIGKTRAFGPLVRRRLGDSACRILVEPLLRERFGVPADDVDVAIAAPGFSEALSRAGSLTAAALAYSERNAERETGVEPTGGWSASSRALLERLSLYGVELLAAPAADIEWQGDSWRTALGGGRVFESAALVVDPECGLSGASRRVISDRGAAPARSRVHARIDILDPSDLPVGAVGVRSIGTWSLRIAHRREGGSWALCSGPAVPAREAGATDPRPELAAILQEAGLIPAPEAEWEVRTAPAPFVTLEERHRSEGALRILAAAEPMLLPVGRSLHGGDLSVSLGAARGGAIALRRHLLGLSE